MNFSLISLHPSSTYIRMGKTFSHFGWTIDLMPRYYTHLRQLWYMLSPWLCDKCGEQEYPSFWQINHLSLLVKNYSS
jgi:hypothetical protein